MGENFSRKEMWRLNTILTAWLTSWWAHLQMRNVEGTKEWLQQFCVRASLRFVLERMKVEFEQSSERGEN